MCVYRVVFYLKLLSKYLNAGLLCLYPIIFPIIEINSGVLTLYSWENGRFCILKCIIFEKMFFFLNLFVTTVGFNELSVNIISGIWFSGNIIIFSQLPFNQRMLRICYLLPKGRRANGFFNEIYCHQIHCVEGHMVWPLSSEPMCDVFR